MFLPPPNEDKILISVGSTCNVCEEADWRRSKILIANHDGSDLKEYADGLRNSVFMAIHPVTGEVWATEMGRDLLGDDIPPDEINIVQQGNNYGWPYCYGDKVHDQNFDPAEKKSKFCEQESKKPQINLPAHSAPLGLAFFPEKGWPEEHWHDLLVAHHGSWNRTEPTGYKIVRYQLNEKGQHENTTVKQELQPEDFINGWLTKEGALGRPVDIVIQPEGSIYISDDKAGVIYKVTRT